MRGHEPSKDISCGHSSANCIHGVLTQMTWVSAGYVFPPHQPHNMDGRPSGNTACEPFDQERSVSLYITWGHCREIVQPSFSQKKTKNEAHGCVWVLMQP